MSSMNTVARSPDQGSIASRMKDNGPAAIIRRAGALPALLLLALGTMTGHVQAETVTYYYTNTQGTPLATADATGNVLSTSDYRPYGVQALGTPTPGPGYTGHINDPGAGLVYMQARYYDPAAGRFLSPDPKASRPADVMTFGRFGYANENPIRYTDPYGREACPGKSRSVCVRSDKSGLRDVPYTGAMYAAAISVAPSLTTTKLPEQSNLLFGTGDVTTQAGNGTPFTAKSSYGLSWDHFPNGTTGVVHSHVDGNIPNVSSDGFKSPGDSTTLGVGVVNFVWSRSRLGVYSVNAGHEQFEVLKGRMDSKEGEFIEGRMNATFDGVKEQQDKTLPVPPTLTGE